MNENKKQHSELIGGKMIGSSEASQSSASQVGNSNFSRSNDGKPSGDKGGVSTKSNIDYDDDFDNLESSPKNAYHETGDSSANKTFGDHASTSPSIHDNNPLNKETVIGTEQEPRSNSGKPLSRGRERLQSAGDDYAYGDDDFEDFVE